jgi:putative ubiquitin-RnfH superfamily antitoxin RatB of RatAB toxin-antitoxin module
MAERIKIEVVSATPEQVFRRTLDLPEGATVADAVAAAGFDDASLPHQPVEQNVGIFGRRVTVGQVLRDGDRVELYRPLRIDPMEARRRRADRAR